MTIAWVIGRGGLLGSALERALVRRESAVFVPRDPFVWTRGAQLLDDLALEAHRFAERVGPSRRWEIYWAAGVGTMSSIGETLELETQALAGFLAALGRTSLDGRHGRLALASSAGAIYAGSSDPVITERSVDRPTTAYASAKLEQERLIGEYAARSGAGVLIARLSTLYGVNQAGAKQQGLLSHMSRCVIRNQPIRIFVPLDTIRDYVSAEDAADAMLDTIAPIEPGRVVCRIVASEQPTTISEIVSIFRRIARRQPRIITSTTAATSLYTRRVHFRSEVGPRRSRPSANLMIGVARILEAERLRHVRGHGTSGSQTRVAGRP